ncbi:MAG: peptide deformylase [bacterium]|nr:peptide deformylase [bacterium]
MKKLALVPANVAVLHEKTKKIPLATIVQADFQKLIDEMIYTMYEENGIGLAATQVGKDIALATLVPDPHRFDFYKNGSREAIVIINPTIANTSIRSKSEDEGCLSVPGFVGTVKRHSAVTVQFTDRDGTTQTVKARGLLAHVFQHEIDHLNGTLFLDRAEKLFKIEHA